VRVRAVDATNFFAVAKMETDQSTAAPSAESPSADWHTLDAAEAVAAVDTDATRGLTAEEAARRRELHGPNALPEGERRSLLAVFMGQFKSPLIYLLFAAAGIALALGHSNDAVVIFVVVLLNAVIGAVQEGRAEKSLAALRKLEKHRARVVRSGIDVIIEAREVVPGDILVLEAGDAVAADARLLDGASLEIAEAALTGESLPVSKHVVPVALDTSLADRTNMVYAGTHVTAGRARAVVVSTGVATEIGHIAALAEGAAETTTPLERRIADFGRYIIVVAVVLFGAIVGVGLLRGLPLGEIFMIGISQIVGIVPEGLPVAMTIALSVGVQRMARRKAVVRRLASVETLGSTTIICSDKTGTLTRNEMTVSALHLPRGGAAGTGGRDLAVTGVGYDPVGEFQEAGRALDLAVEPDLRGLLEAAVLCSDAHLQGPDDDHAAMDTRRRPHGGRAGVGGHQGWRGAGKAPRSVPPPGRDPLRRQAQDDGRAARGARRHAGRAQGRARVLTRAVR
jgi:magnesium-transporting ATPase (P-type)